MYYFDECWNVVNECVCVDTVVTFMECSYHSVLSASFNYRHTMQLYVLILDNVGIVIALYIGSQ